MTRRNGVDKSSFREVGNQLNLGSHYQFFQIQTPDDISNPKARRLAHSHAVAQGLEKKRKLQQKSGHNFRDMSLKYNHGQTANKRKEVQAPLRPPLIPSADTPDPFQMLAAESPKLLAMHTQYRARQASGPKFSISDELVLPNFRSVLRKGLEDHALLSALMLTFTSSITSSNINKDYLEYQIASSSSIRRRLASPAKATSESTLGAILLLAGVEARLGLPHQVQLHMGAIQQLLDICRSKGVYLSDGIKRAIFWQDLNASVLTGSIRVVDHTTFSELQWRRDPFLPDFFPLPRGFQDDSQLLGEKFVEVLKEISALQCIRDSNFFGSEDVISMAHIDNHQASIQSRLVDLPRLSPISECCPICAQPCCAANFGVPLPLPFTSH